VQKLLSIVAVAVAIVALAIPHAIQAQEGGVQVDGWQARLDRNADANRVLHFRTMAEGIHASTAGNGAATFWRPADTHNGDYAISATFTQTAPSSHPNAYGLFFGGSDLSGTNQRYTYFVIRENGQYLLRKRMGDETSDATPWAAHDAIKTLDADGHSTNSLTVEVGASQVRFLINDIEVNSQPRSSFNTDGIAGLRVNHQLDLHIANVNLGM